MKIDQTTKTVITVTILAFVAVLVADQILKAMGLSSKNIKPFVYTGKNVKQTYYSWIIPLAKEVGAEKGIPWQAIAVQTALETGWGKSSLLRTYNNFGGIKDTDGINSTKPMGTKEFVNGKWISIKDGFEIYKTPYDGLIGYGDFFHINKRYAQALKFPNDPYKFIEEIKKAGYATDPNYVAKLHGMLNLDFKNT